MRLASWPQDSAQTPAHSAIDSAIANTAAKQVSGIEILQRGRIAS